MRLFVLSRHGESVLNTEDRVNGDPTVLAPLTEHGRERAALLGLQVRGLPLDACLHTRFGRTLETAQIALEGRDVPLVEEELLDDVRVGELEGWTVGEYRAWKLEHTRADRFPGGESLDDSARRYAKAYPAPRAPLRMRPRRLPRDPDPLRAERHWRVRRPRPAGAHNPQRVPLPLRRARAGESGRRDRASR
jgi:Histidine phosphatase superfamily (branch 1)